MESVRYVGPGCQKWFVWRYGRGFRGFWKLCRAEGGLDNIVFGTSGVVCGVLAHVCFGRGGGAGGGLPDRWFDWSGGAGKVLPMTCICRSGGADGGLESVGVEGVLEERVRKCVGDVAG